MLFIRTNAFFLLANAVNHVLAGALRGRGDAKAPMIIMIACFVGIRQVYLYVISRVMNSPAAAGFSYPVGWLCCCVVELLYYFCSRRKAMAGMAD